MRYEREDWPSRAMRIIYDRTRALPEYTAARAYVEIRAYLVCRDQNVAGMRALGGFSEVLRAAIDELPVQYRAHTGSAMFAWSVTDQLRSEIETLRAELQFRVASRRDELARFRARSRKWFRGGRAPVTECRACNGRGEKRDPDTDSLVACDYCPPV